jgi:hypothetical protein
MATATAEEWIEAISYLCIGVVRLIVLIGR